MLTMQFVDILAAFFIFAGADDTAITSVRRNYPGCQSGQDLLQ